MADLKVTLDGDAKGLQQADKSIKDLRGHLKDLQNQAVGLSKTSAEFQRLSQEADGVRKALAKAQSVGKGFFDSLKGQAVQFAAGLVSVNYALSAIGRAYRDVYEYSKKNQTSTSDLVKKLEATQQATTEIAANSKLFQGVLVLQIELQKSLNDLLGDAGRIIDKNTQSQRQQQKSLIESNISAITAGSVGPSGVVTKSLSESEIELLRLYQGQLSVVNRELNQYNEANEQRVKNLLDLSNLDTNSAIKERIRLLQDEVDNVKRGSEEYNRLAAALAKVKAMLDGKSPISYNYPSSDLGTRFDQTYTSGILARRKQMRASSDPMQFGQISRTGTAGDTGVPQAGGFSPIIEPSTTTADRFTSGIKSGLADAAGNMTAIMLRGGMSFSDMIKQQLMQAGISFLATFAKAGVASLLNGGSFIDRLLGGLGFAGGGYTPGVGVRQAAGVVHGNEWVAPTSMKDHPIYGMQIAHMESIRRTMKGFADGGFSSQSVLPSLNMNQTFVARIGNRDIAMANRRGQVDLNRMVWKQ